MWQPAAILYINNNPWQCEQAKKAEMGQEKKSTHRTHDCTQFTPQPHSDSQAHACHTIDCPSYCANQEGGWEEIADAGERCGWGGVTRVSCMWSARPYWTVTNKGGKGWGLTLFDSNSSSVMVLIADMNAGTVPVNCTTKADFSIATLIAHWQTCCAKNHHVVLNLRH